MKRLSLLIMLLVLSNNVFSQTIKFENHSDDEKIAIPIIKLKIGNNKDKLFIVDTGATFSSIDIKYIYDNYKISYLKNEFKIATFNNENNNDNIKIVHTYINDTLQINLISLDLNDISDKLNIDLYGIIGSDFLRRNKLIIDYNRREIYQAKD